MKVPKKVLLADDDKNLRQGLQTWLARSGWEVRPAENGLAAQRLLTEEAFDVVLADLKMPGLDGQALLEWILASGPAVPVVLMSAHGEIQDAVKALKAGALDYLTKPFDPDELTLRLEAARVRGQGVRKPGPGAGTIAATGAGTVPGAGAFAGPGATPGPGAEVSPSPSPSPYPSAAFAQVWTLAAKVAPTPALVLITGESGTGKEVMARRLHELSPWAAGPFVGVNIGALPDTLLESELFGYEKGAFTGAERRKPGLFEAAQGGTLFLDEIGELPLPLQVKLLRVLQERKVLRLGSTTPLPVEARILAATNRDLKAEVTAGRFREDLFYRLNVVPLALPPLRLRREDLPQLGAELLGRIGERLGRRDLSLSPEALDVLGAYDFPGNIRELENLLERAAIFAPRPALGASDLDLPAPGAAGGPGAAGDPAVSPTLADGSGPSGTLAALERRLISETLLRWEGRQTRAAQELGISRRTLFNKIREYGLKAEPLEGTDPDA